MPKILGISAYYHDAAAALLVDGEIAAAAQEERFTREKHTADFPAHAIRYCLDEAGCTLDNLDAIVFYDKPLLKFERLLETYYAFAPRGLRQFIASMPVWLKEKLFLKKRLRDSLTQITPYDRRRVPLLFSAHHASHAASAFYPSPFTDAAILTIDGVGEWATATIGRGSGTRIVLHKELRFPHSVGLLYSAFTAYLGFRVNSGEYKLMGLAPYGNPDDEQTRRFVALIKTHLVTIKDDGSLWLNPAYFAYMTGCTMTHARKWTALFGFPPVTPEGALEQHHCNLAHAIQQVTEEIVIRMARTAKALTGCEYLCMAGGVALNCVANGKLLHEGIFKDVFIQPAAGDAGGALGAAQLAHYCHFAQPREVAAPRDAMQGAYLGPAFSDKEAVLAFKRHNAVYRQCSPFDELCREVAALLAAGNVVGWFQGRMEFGPRALGNRSILADARNTAMQKRLNLKIKYREGFRPFAPSVLREDAPAFFDLAGPSPYMVLIAGVQPTRRKALPQDYHARTLWEKLYYPRSDVPAVTHLDFSARVHTVDRDTNPRFWQLINAFKQQTGYGLLVNTSFNVRGEPIVCTPEDAYRCFMHTEMDVLVVNNFILHKAAQPDAQQRERWTIATKPD